jgi:hypothetical protein
MGYWGQTLPQQAIHDLLDLSGGHPERIMLRYQAAMGRVTANWGIYDTAVAQCNAAGIPIYLCCKRFDGASVTGHATTSEIAAFASAVATRYKGKLAGIEIGNEDYGYSDFGALADAMLACYDKLKQIDSKMLVLPGCTLQRNTTNLKQALTVLLSRAGHVVDGTNVHTYFGIPGTGSHTPQDGSVGNTPSFPQYIQAVQEVCKAQGFPGMGIYDTEFGFASTGVNHGNVLVFNEADQAKHMLYCLDTARTMGVKHMSWFTLGYHSPPDGMSLRQPHGPTLAYTALKDYIAKYPTWGSATPQPPDPNPQPVISTKQHILDLLRTAKTLSPIAANQCIDQAIGLLNTL